MEFLAGNRIRGLSSAERIKFYASGSSSTDLSYAVLQIYMNHLEYSNLTQASDVGSISYAITAGGGGGSILGVTGGTRRILLPMKHILT